MLKSVPIKHVIPMKFKPSATVEHKHSGKVESGDCGSSGIYLQPKPGRIGRLRDPWRVPYGIRNAITLRFGKPVVFYNLYSLRRRTEVLGFKYVRGFL